MYAVSLTIGQCESNLFVRFALSNVVYNAKSDTCWTLLETPTVCHASVASLETTS